MKKSKRVELDNEQIERVVSMALEEKEGSQRLVPIPQDIWGQTQNTVEGAWSIFLISWTQRNALTKPIM